MFGNQNAVGQYALKALTTLSMSVCVAILSAGSSLAQTWSSSKAWGAQQASFAPDFGNTSMYRYDATDGKEYVSPKTRFNFDSSAVTAIYGYYFDDDGYYTFDISILDAYNTSMTAHAYMYTTLPNPKKDRDDDPEWRGGNGYYDETEAVSLSPTYIEQNTDYRFESWFEIINPNTKVEFEFGSQISKPAGSEYNVVQISPHITRVFPF